VKPVATPGSQSPHSLSRRARHVPTCDAVLKLIDGLCVAVTTATPPQHRFGSNRRQLAIKND
jgi:hypothetical protein